MKTNHRRLTGILVSLLALAAVPLAGCDAPKPQAQAPVAAASDSITRQSAIQSAERDARFRYAELAISRVDARRLGAFWVVELTSQTGSGLRYTISANDGSIRERNTFQ